jgi:hypothetical protein
MNYRDFDLHLRKAGRCYLAHVTYSETGEAEERFSLPFTKLEFENLILKLRPLTGNRSTSLNRENAAKELGGGLFAAVFQGNVATRLASCIELARREQTKVRINLRLDDELVSLPWEFLYDESLNRFLALSKETALVRYLEQPCALEALEVAAPLKVLVMISSPQDQAALNVEAEWNKLHEAFTQLAPNLVQVDQVKQASLAALHRQLSRDHYHIFHYIGHGVFDERGETSYLWLEDDEGKSSAIAGEKIGVHLHNHPSLRLVILNACEGARASTHDVYSGIAQGLIREGIPAVIGMQFEISDEAAITFSRDFYDAIARGKPVDEALDNARRAIHAAQNGGTEWGTPVLYLRAQNGHLFDIEPLPEAATPAPSPAPVKFEVITRTDVLSPSPAPLILPRIAPTGTLSSKSRFYIERAAEKPAVELVQDTSEGSTVMIIKSGQGGGSSLGQRLEETALSVGKRTVGLNFQRHFNSEDFADSEKFHYRFCLAIANELELDDKVEEAWQKYCNLSLGNRCTYYVQDLLEKLQGQPLLLAMDEIDLLGSTKFKSDFFAMLRNWHNERASEPVFKQLDLVLITSLEQSQLIDGALQSDFNVGLVVRLEDFSASEVAELAARYELSLSDEHLAQLMSWLSGHPYLSQLALHALAKNKVTMDTLFANAYEASSPFVTHLTNLHTKVRETSVLLEGVKRVAGRGEPDEPTILRLRHAGLVRRQGKTVQFRCRLYEEYFRQ